MHKWLFFFRNLSLVFRIMLVSTFLVFVVIPWNETTVQAASKTLLSPCVVTVYYLHGRQPATSSCLQHQILQGNRVVSPKTSQGSCSNPNATLWSSVNGTLCFVGYGYLGFTQCCSQVYQEYFAGCCDGWLWYYNGSTGTRFYISGETKPALKKYFTTVTQICINPYGSAYC